MVVNVTPSTVIGRVVDLLENVGLTMGIEMVGEREGEFTTGLEATLTGIGLDPIARRVAEETLDAEWTKNQRNAAAILNGQPDTVEVIVGSGFHAAVYAATRVRMGYPAPVVLEQKERVGGVFAMTDRSSFFLNSRNRPGGAGLAGDLGTSLNHLPGGIIQATNIGMGEYQTNTDMAYVIRMTLAQYATVIPGSLVTTIEDDEETGRLLVSIDGKPQLVCSRVILAQGLGEPRTASYSASKRILSFPAFMQRMTEPWPLRGLRRIAVLGNGDSAKCAVEAILGLGPQPFMACAALDHVQQVDWYAPTLPSRCKDWLREVRGRYSRIGRYLKADRQGVRRLRILNRTVEPVPVAETVTIDGRSYDLVVCCVGNAPPSNPRGDYASTDTPWSVAGQTIARVRGNVFAVGPHAQIPFNQREDEEGISDTPGNEVAMFRLGPKTAMLAATLPLAARRDLDLNPF